MIHIPHIVCIHDPIQHSKVFQSTYRISMIQRNFFTWDTQYLYRLTRTSLERKKGIGYQCHYAAASVRERSHFSDAESTGRQQATRGEG